ncbi:acyl-CoA dehydrogenase family protein [Citricoccus parietis]
MVRDFCDTHFPESAVRQTMESGAGFDPELWTRMAQEMGLTGIAVAEEFGGSGAGQVELNIVVEELGRALAVSPFFSTVVLASNLLSALSDAELNQSLLPGIVDGSTTATVAFIEPAGRFDEDLSTAGSESGGQWTLQGTKVNVLDGGTADHLLVSARTDRGTSIFEVKAGAAGMAVEQQDTLDLTRPQAQITFDGTPARLVGEEGRGAEPLSSTLRLASVSLSSENAGGALRLIELSADYARTREQFGKVIGGYQAIKQKIADVLLQVELARAAAHQVARAADHDPDVLPLESAMAHALTSEAYVQAAYETIQIHGGIGFTWEHPAHLYFRRAKSNEVLFGTPSHHRELAARQLLGQ